MDTQQFSQLIQQPEQLQQVAYDLLERLLVEYPYCGVLRLLLLRKCQMDRHPAFDQQLQLAAIHLPDRVRLHDFLKQQQDTVPVPPVGKIPPFPIPDNFPNADSDTEDKKKTESDIIELDGILKKTKKKRFQLPRIPVLQDKTVLEILSGNHTDLLPVVPPHKHKDWDKQGKKDRKSLLDFSPDMEAFLKQLAATKHKTTTDAAAPQKQYGLEEMAQKSLAENEEIISETLADLLAQQGQKEKAIKMYSALSLKFPQKSRFFANRIDRLQTTD